MLQQIGVPMTAIVGRARHLSELAELASFFDCVMIDFDALLDFRRKSPGIAVMLLSSLVKDDDLSGERSAITDVTLRVPTTGDRLRGALSAATENHAMPFGADQRT